MRVVEVPSRCRVGNLLGVVQLARIPLASFGADHRIFVGIVVVAVLVVVDMQNLILLAVALSLLLGAGRFTNQTSDLRWRRSQ